MVSSGLLGEGGPRLQAFLDGRAQSSRHRGFAPSRFAPSHHRRRHRGGCRRFRVIVHPRMAVVFPVESAQNIHSGLLYHGMVARIAPASRNGTMML